MRRIGTLLLACLMLMSFAIAEGSLQKVEEEIMLDDGEEFLLDLDVSEPEEEAPAVLTARDDFIDRIINLGEQLYIQADGKSKRAHYAGDIYVCKNFTVYLFRQNRDSFRMAEFPTTQLVIPNNLPAKKCKPYYYGFLWEDVPASKGNPFYEAAQFVYDTSLTKEENLELAKAFMRQVQRGDYFQMSADYAYGVGAHSAIMLSYDPETDSIHWMDSNMRGGKRNGIRYGIVQFDEVASVEWWAKAFCHKKRGATIYRLRDDIIYAEDAQK